MKILLTLVMILPIYLNAQVFESKEWLKLCFANNHSGWINDDLIDAALIIKSPAFNVGFSHQFSKFLSLDIDASMGKVKDYRTINIKLEEANYIRANVFSTEASLIIHGYKINNRTLKPRKLVPNAGIGFGFNAFNENVFDIESGGTVSVPILLGLNYRINQQLKLALGVNFRLNNVMLYRQLNVGIHYAIQTEIDTDGDGLVDELDRCPFEKGILSKHGCPMKDMDEDGFNDEIDECPCDAGKIKGCPDRDRDGVADINDKCPNIRGLYNGCPDKDKDGIIDSEDKCPETPGEIEGCPDSDGDGVSDLIDKCPKIKGELLFKGCPETQELETEQGITNFKLESKPFLNEEPVNVNFEIDRKNSKLEELFINNQKRARVNSLYRTRINSEVAEARISADMPLLIFFFNLNEDELQNEYKEEVAAMLGILKSELQLKVKVHGHTDDTGKPDYNELLSTLRAERIANFLIQNGISKERVVIKGFGQDMPIAVNENEDGRFLNRRVEIYLFR